jgi:hypothetical protein
VSTSSASIGGKGSFEEGTSAQTNRVGELDGHWRVERIDGLLPPNGVTKRITGGTGWTLLGGVPVGFFRVAARTLVYRGWPVRDELERGPDGAWLGRGILAGREFCRFRMVPDDSA